MAFLSVAIDKSLPSVYLISSSSTVLLSFGPCSKN